jgi:hypothetical protein
MQQEWAEKISQLRNKVFGLSTEIQPFRKFHGLTNAQDSSRQRKSAAYAPSPGPFTFAQHHAALHRHTHKLTPSCELSKEVFIPIDDAGSRILRVRRIAIEGC